MAKLTLTDLASLTNETSAITTINNNNNAIETALENTLSRDGTSPNSMGAQLDMNTHKIINLDKATGAGEALEYSQLQEKVEDITTIYNQTVTAKNQAQAAQSSAELAESNAEAAEAQSEAILLEVQTLFDAYNNQYLGTFSAPPTVDNKGNPLDVGDLYYNSVSLALMVYDGTAWQKVADAGYQPFSANLTTWATLAPSVDAQSLVTAADYSAMRTLLGLGTAATSNTTDFATAAQGALADTATQPEDLSEVATSGSYNDLTDKPATVRAAFSLDDYIFGGVRERRLIVAYGVDDEFIREIGNVLYDPEDAAAPYKLVYSGYSGTYADNTVYVFAATSLDGVTWTKSGKLITPRSAEDPYLVKVADTYYLYVEDKEAVPFRNIRCYTSTDFSAWTDQGDVLIYNGASWENQDVSSPTVLYDGGTFYLFYEGRSDAGNDGAIGLATSADGVTFTRHVGNPIITGYQIAPGPAYWARHAAPDDIRKVGNRYVMTFHGWYERLIATSTYSGTFYGAILTSRDLIHWEDALGHPVSLPEPTSRNTLMYHECDGVLYVLSEDRANGIEAFSLAPPPNSSWEIKKSASQTISTSGWQLVTFDEPIFRADASWNGSTNTFTAPKSGLYRLSAEVRFNAASAGAGRVSTRFYVNGSIVLSAGSMNLSTALTYTVPGVRTYFLQAGDTVIVQAERSAEITTNLTLSDSAFSIQQIW